MTPGVLGLSAPAPPTRRRHRAPIAAAIVIGVVVAATLIWGVLGSPVPSKPVTEAEARAYLDKAIQAGLARDFQTLCRLNGSTFNCEIDLDRGGARETSPDVPPSSVNAFYAEADADTDTPGWVLTVRGRNARDEAYTTEVMVFRDHEGHLKAINIVWWSGNRLVVNDTGVQTPDSTPSATETG